MGEPNPFEVIRNKQLGLEKIDTYTLRITEIYAYLTPERQAQIQKAFEEFVAEEDLAFDTKELAAARIGFIAGYRTGFEDAY